MASFYVKAAGGFGFIGLFGLAAYANGNRQSHETGFHHFDTDPNLRKVEKDVLIAKYMRDYARKVSCADEVQAFNECVQRQNEKGKFQGLMAFRTCGNESNIMMECQNKKFTDPEFYFEMKEIYMRDKKIFKMTNVNIKARALVRDSVFYDKIYFEMENMDKDGKKYYDGVKQMFDETGDIEAFDKYLLEKYDSVFENESLQTM